MEREFANPDKHTHNLLRRRTFVRNDNAANLVLLDEGRQIGILTENRDLRKLFRQDLVAFIDKAYNALTAGRSPCQIFCNLSARFRSTKHKDVVRPIALTEQRPQEDIDEHAEQANEQNG